MESKVKRHVWNFEPTAAQLVDTDPATYVVMGVKRGTRILSAAVRIGVLFDGTGPTISVGDVDVDGLVDELDITMGTIGLYDGYGAYFSGANGRLYTEDDTVDLVYTGAADVTQGQAVVIITYIDEE